MLVSAPPVIPRTRKSEPDELEEYLTLWVRTGTAHVRLASGEHYRVEPGSGLCLPPGADHDLWTEPGTVTVPLFSDRHPLPGAGGTAAAVPVAAPATDRLVRRYGRWAWEDLSAFADRTAAPSHAADLVPPLYRPDRARGVAADAPALPRREPAAAVARELIGRPDLDRDVQEWAARAGCSASTLRRSFLAQTGLSFADWRHRARLARGAELLAEGCPVGEVGARVGFSSRWGFSGAFRTHYGLSPREYAGTARGSTTAGSGLLGAAPTEPLDVNVMVWVRSGELRARHGGRSWAGRPGDVLWLPAGSRITGVPEDCLPLSVLCTDCVQLARPQRAHFPSSWADWLLWASVSTNTLLRPAEQRGAAHSPEHTRHRHVLDAFAARVDVERARSVPLPRDAAARATAREFLASMGSPDRHDPPPPAEIEAAFRRETGLGFTRWRQAARMRVARRLLMSGVPASAVAHRVGYSLASNFSRAFSRFHGIGPREFQRQEGLDAPEAQSGSADHVLRRL